MDILDFQKIFQILSKNFPNRIIAIGVNSEFFLRLDNTKDKEPSLPSWE